MAQSLFLHDIFATPNDASRGQWDKRGSVCDISVPKIYKLGVPETRLIELVSPCFTLSLFGRCRRVDLNGGWVCACRKQAIEHKTIIIVEKLNLES